MSILRSEATIAVRQLRRTRAAAVAMSLAVALSVGVGLAVASELHLTVSPPIGAAGADQLLVIQSEGPYRSRATDVSHELSPRLSIPDFWHLSSQPHLFEIMAGFNDDRVAVIQADRARLVCRIFVIGDVFGLVGIRPRYGRAFDPTDFAATAPPVVMLTHEVWVRYFDADPSVVGNTVQLDGQVFTIIGVLQRGSRSSIRPRRSLFPADDSYSCVATPLLPGTGGESEGVIEYLMRQDDVPWITAVGRPVRGVGARTLAQALAADAAYLRERSPARNTAWGLVAVPYAEWRVSAVAPFLEALAVAVLLMLATATATVVGLLVAEAVRRAPEVATRHALGATRGQLMQGLLIRALVWCAPGGCLALLVGYLTFRLVNVAGSSAESGSLLAVERAALLVATGAVLVFAMATTGAATTFWQLRSIDLTRALRDAGQRSRRSGQRVGLVLLTVQVAASLALATGAGTLVRHLWRMGGIDFGFDAGPSGFVVDLRFPRPPDEDASGQLVFLRRVLDHVTNVPGVIGAAVSSSPPLTHSATVLSGDIAVQHSEGVSNIEEIEGQFVTSDYARVLGLRILRGRFLTHHDDQSGAPGAVVDDRFVDRYLGSSSPLGATIRFNRKRYPIVGVVASVVRSSEEAAQPDGSASGMVYLPMSQFERPPNWTFLVVRRQSGSTELEALVAREVSSMDERLVVGDPRAFSALWTSALAGRQRMAELLSGIAIVILLLTVASFSSALNHVTASRSAEVALRYCLGARPTSIAWLGLRSVGVSAAVGLLAGAALGTALDHFLASRMPGVERFDMLAVGAGGFVVAVACALSSVAPIGRLLRTDPVGVLRST